MPHILVFVVCIRIALQRSRSVIDLIGLSPLLIDKDYRDKDDDLCHDAKKGPESSQATADTQVDFVSSYAEFVTSRANVVPEVTVDVQVVNGQTGLVGGILDLIFVSSIGDTNLGFLVVLLEPEPISR